MFSPKNNYKPLPREYVAKKFFEIGFYPIYNKSLDNYQCSCVECLEGSSGIGHARRCYYLPDKDLIYCHHCGLSMRPLGWIMKYGRLTYQEVMDEASEDDYTYISIDSPEFNPFGMEIGGGEKEHQVKDPIDLTNSQQMAFYGKKEIVRAVYDYAKKRRLLDAVNAPKHWYTSMTDPIHRGRLVIPFFNRKGKISFYQSRDVGMGKRGIRYISEMGGEKSVFNIDRVDDSRGHYFIFEGPIDACFMKNSVAVGGITPSKSLFSKLQEQQLEELESERIWVLDNQHIDKTAYEKSKLLLEQGEKVFIWPNLGSKNPKDFNDICEKLKINEIPCDFVLENTFGRYSGLVKLKSLKTNF